MFEDQYIDVQEEYHIFHNDQPTMFDDDAEKVRVEVEKNKTCIGHRQKFPQNILDIGYKHGHMIFLLGSNKTVRMKCRKKILPAVLIGKN